MTDVLTEQVAFQLWWAEAARAAPNVAKQRTIETFRSETNALDRLRWDYLARAVIPLIYNAAIEEAAKVAESCSSYDPYSDYDLGVIAAADAIRNLAKP